MPPPAFSATLGAVAGAVGPTVSIVIVAGALAGLTLPEPSVMVAVTVAGP